MNHFGLPHIGMSTPWGRAQHIKRIAKGIFSVSTPSHGGIKLSRERNGKVPDYMREPGGWYEEDCDWCIPFLVFTADILAERDEYALKNIAEGAPIRTLRNWRPEAFEKFFGTELAPGESYIKDERAKNGGRLPWESDAGLAAAGK